MEIPYIFKCPISQLIYSDPVICSDGNCYEYDLINNWLSLHNKSPITRQLMLKSYCKNSQLKERIYKFIKLNINYIDKNYLYNYNNYIINFIINKDNYILKNIITFDWLFLRELNKWEDFLLKLEKETISNLVKIGINKNCLIINSYPIHFLCKNYDDDVIKIAINNNYNLESSYNLLRPIHLSINFNKNIEVLKLLIKENVNLEAELSNKIKPIHLACIKHKLDFMELLLKENVDVDSTFFYDNIKYRNLREFIIKMNTDIKQECKEINLIYNYKIK